MITDHVFRPAGGDRSALVRTGLRGGPAVAPGMCGWLGTCNRPQDDHITHLDFRAAHGEVTR